MTHARLPLGLNLPCTEGSMDGATPRWSDILAMSTTAEAMGFDSTLDAACEAVGRDPRTLVRSAETLVDTRAGFSPSEVVERIGRYAALGIGHLQVQILPRTVAGLQAFAPVMELSDAAVQGHPASGSAA